MYRSKHTGQLSKEVAEAGGTLWSCHWFCDWQGSSCNKWWI